LSAQKISRESSGNHKEAHKKDQHCFVFQEKPRATTNKNDPSLLLSYFADIKPKREHAQEKYRAAFAS
jgi:hypothetical protein